MAENKKSVDELLKEIVIDAVSEYLNKPVDKDLPKNNTQANISKKTGIPIATLSRYLNPEANSYPSLVEVMEILAIIGNREALLKFGLKSNTQAAKFIQTQYAQYLNLNPLTPQVSEDLAPQNEEILRITNESTSIIEKRIKNENKWLYWMIVALITFLGGMQTKQLLDVEKRLNKKIENLSCKSK